MSSLSRPSARAGAVQHLLADVILNLRLQFVCDGRAMPGPRESRGEAVDIGVAHDDLRVIDGGVDAAAAEDREQHAAEQQEMQQRFAQ